MLFLQKISYIVSSYKPWQLGPNSWEDKLCLSQARTQRGVIVGQCPFKNLGPVWLWMVSPCRILAKVTVKTSTGATAEREPLAMAELREGAILRPHS
jgi:hypothetical protein